MLQTSRQDRYRWAHDGTSPALLVDQLSPTPNSGAFVSSEWFISTSVCHLSARSTEEWACRGGLQCASWASPPLPGPCMSGQYCQQGEQDSTGSRHSSVGGGWGRGLSWLFQLHEEVLNVIVEAVGA